MLLMQSEKDFMAQILELAKLRGWLRHHTRPALSRAGKWNTPVQGDVGFPDLVLCRGDRCVIWEIKAEKGRVSPTQVEWLGALSMAGIEARVVREKDWSYIEGTLM